MTIAVTDLHKLPFLPEKSAYSYTGSSGVTSVFLDGGASKTRVDLVGSTANVGCSWILNKEEYDYFMLFYAGIAKRGAVSFQIDLILDTSALEEFTCRFVPDTLTLNEPSSNSFIVSAELEVEPILIDESSILIRLLVLSDPEGFDSLLNQLDQLVNIDFANIP